MAALVGVVCALVAAGGVALALGALWLGVALATAGALLALASWGVANWLVDVSLRAHANVLSRLASRGRRRTDASAEEDPGAEAVRRAVDAKVGFLLRDADLPVGGPEEGPVAALVRENRRAERVATYAWLCAQGEPLVARLEAQDGAPLVARVYECAPGSPRWAILAHGYAGRGTEMMLYARHWGELGFNLLVPDMRGFGDSGGSFAGMGWLDRRDLVSWAGFLALTYGEGVRVCLHGHSMGGASVCMATGERDLPPQVRAVVSDCAYTSVWDVFAGVPAFSSGLPEHPTLDLARLAFRRRRGGYDIVDADARRAVAHARVPMLFVHGGADTLVAPAMGRALYAACGSADKALLEVPGAGHCQSSLADPDAYWGAVRDLVERAEA